MTLDFIFSKYLFMSSMAWIESLHWPLYNFISLISMQPAFNFFPLICILFFLPKIPRHFVFIIFSTLNDRKLRQCL